MIATMMNWCYITILAYISGSVFSKLLNRMTGYWLRHWETVIVSGLMLLTVYAEIFSLFAGVGLFANIIICVLAVIGLLYCKDNLLEKIIQTRKEWEKNRWKAIWNILLICGIVLLFAAFSCQRAIHADTDGYHATAIRWIEEYGVVKGLGNLYNRLAYNSAFLCLQALFSWKFIINQSMHVMNGYIACIMVLYSILKLRESSFVCSKGNVFRLLLLFYIIYPGTLIVMASPNTDHMTLLYVMFIIGKWCDYLDDNEKSAIPYAVLAILAVFTISLKLSAGLLIILVAKPGIIMIQQKKWNQIVLFLCMGAIVICPWLIRNVMISGYLVYPYTAIDLFHVDWKMLPYMVNYDKNEIMVYGRGLYDVNKSRESILKWVPVWWNEQNIWIRSGVFLNIILAPAGAVMAWKAKCRKAWDEASVILLTVILFCGWFFTAPLARYGLVYTLLFPTIVIQNMFRRSQGSIILRRSMILVTIGLFVWIMGQAFMLDNIPLKRSAYYISRECREVEWDGIQVYIPVEDGNMGYYYFPSTQHESVLNYIELRGNVLKDGFRIKEEYKNASVDTYGRIYLQ